MGLTENHHYPCEILSGLKFFCPKDQLGVGSSKMISIKKRNFYFRLTIYVKPIVLRRHKYLPIK